MRDKQFLFKSSLLAGVMLFLLATIITSTFPIGMAQVNSGPPNNSPVILLNPSTVFTNGEIHITGQLRNVGDKTLNYVKVLASFYDQSNNLLGSEFGFADPATINPNSISNFAITGDSSNGRGKLYTLTVAWQNLDGTSGYSIMKPETKKPSINSKTIPSNPILPQVGNNVSKTIPSNPILPQVGNNVSKTIPSNHTQPQSNEQKLVNHQPSPYPLTISYLGTVGSEGSTPGKFFSPASIEYSSSNKKIYVSDLDNNRIQIFDTNGHFISSWGAPKYQFAHPEDVATDADGFVYIPEVENNRIQKFDSAGNFVTKWGSPGIKEGQFNHPGDVAIDSQNKLLFVTDIGNSRIQKFDLEGKFISSWGTLGKGEGQFNRPAGITYDEAKQVVYVADTKNNRIQKFDINGKFLGKWESFSFGTPNQKFDRPDGIKYDEFSGYIFVADRKNNKIVVFEENGKPIYELDLLKATKGLVIKPRDVTLDETGKLFVVDKVNNKIHVFSTKSLT